MGVVGLWEHIAGAKESVELETLQGSTLAIDANIWLNASLRGSQIYAYNKSINSHISTLFKRTCALLSQGISPVFVFDGACSGKIRTQPPQSLTQIAQIRSSHSSLSQRSPQKLDLSSNPQDIPSTSRTLTVLKDSGPAYDSEVYRLSKKLLDLLGVEWVESSGDAEQVCAKLEMDGLVVASVTTDSDYFLYGGRVLLHMNFDLVKPTVTRVTMKNIEEQFGLTRTNLLQLSLFLGCDYYKGINKIGFKKGCSIIEHFGIQDDDDILSPIRRFRDSYKHCEGSKVCKLEKQLQKLVSVDCVEQILHDKYKRFLEDCAGVSLKGGREIVEDIVPDICDFIAEYIDWKSERILREINRIMKFKKKKEKKNEKKQLRITDFMQQKVKRSQVESRKRPAKIDGPLSHPSRSRSRNDKDVHILTVTL